MYWIFEFTYKREKKRGSDDPRMKFTLVAMRMVD